MERGGLAAGFDLLAVDVEDGVGVAGAFDFIEREVQRRLISACGKERGRDFLGAVEEAEVARIDVDRGAGAGTNCEPC